MNCESCGKGNDEGANFCSECGAALVGPPSDTTMHLILETESGIDEVTIYPENIPPGAAVLVIKSGPEAGTTFTLTENTTTCGRDSESGIFLDDVTVSRNHAEIRKSDGSFNVHDSGSLNGTFVNHERVDSARLQDADVIQIGKFKLAFFSGETRQ